jgi:hypothetical protein
MSQSINESIASGCFAAGRGGAFGLEAETLAQAGTGVDFGVGNASGADPFAVEITHVKSVRFAATRLASEIFTHHF